MSNLLATFAAMGIDIRKGQKTIFAMLKRLPRYSADDEFIATKTG
jgi:hypothetical protein